MKFQLYSETDVNFSRNFVSRVIWFQAEEQLYDRKLFMAVQENSRLTTEAKMKLQGVDAEADAAEHQYLLSQLSTLELESER